MSYSQDKLDGCFRSFIIEEENTKLPYTGLTKEGYEFKIERGNDLSLCGYIFLKKEIVEKMDSKEKLISDWCPHGGISCCGPLEDNPEIYIYGFDTSHYGDLLNVSDIHDIPECPLPIIIYFIFINNPIFNNKYKLKDALSSGYKDINYILEQINVWSSKINSTYLEHIK